MIELNAIDLAMIERGISVLTLLGVAGCLLFLLRIHRASGQQEQRERGEQEERRRHVRLAYAAALLERVAPRRRDNAVVDLAEGVGWQRR